MPGYETPVHGTLVIAALLLLALGFAGYWIVSYLESGGAPWYAVPWFVGAAVAIIAVGFITGWLRKSDDG